ncbi:hypothetical protein Ahy_A10g048943 isoform A [Arachis hypogaea]|uniref:Transposase (Putative), gypsy type n=1 Tax=Arachis hypogaea TaxID=3818 RepID=A0A445B6A7_ARAHY|nr:hypothetical protein Ahy_A10g048943 isoform A [Arachis hypogaea]
MSHLSLLLVGRLNYILQLCLLSFIRMTKTNQKCSNGGGSGSTWNWVDPEVLNTKSDINIANLTPTKLLQPNHSSVSFGHCTDLDRVCYGSGEEEQERFFFVYKALFTDLMLPLPFSDFHMSILKKIDAAPTQLHPHGWVFVRCFELLCQFHKLTPTVPTFFYFFQLVEKKKGAWLHIHARPGLHKLLSLDLRCFRFKNNFFKVKGSGGGSSVPFFMDQNKNPKFPLCWSEFVKFPDSPVFWSLSDSEKALVTKFQKLKAPFSCSSLINGEGRVLSLWDRRFDFDHHIRHHLFSSPDQDKLRHTGHTEVGHFVKANALRIAAATEFLVEELEKKERQLCRVVTKLEKAEREVAKCLGELERVKKESEYTELCLMREWKKSVRVSFQNAVDQVQLGFPKLNMDSIMLDPFKVVEGDKLVDMKSRRQDGVFAVSSVL